MESKQPELVHAEHDEAVPNVHDAGPYGPAGKCFDPGGC